MRAECTALGRKGNVWGHHKLEPLINLQAFNQENTGSVRWRKTDCTRNCRLATWAHNFQLVLT